MDVHAVASGPDMQGLRDLHQDQGPIAFTDRGLCRSGRATVAQVDLRERHMALPGTGAGVRRADRERTIRCGGRFQHRPFRAVFSESPIGAEPPDYDAVGWPDGISGYLWRLVLAGIWRQREMSDGTYDIVDAIEANRVLDVAEENKRRAAEAAAQRNRRE